MFVTNFSLDDVREQLKQAGNPFDVRGLVGKDHLIYCRDKFNTCDKIIVQALDAKLPLMRLKCVLDRGESHNGVFRIWLHTKDAINTTGFVVSQAYNIDINNIAESFYKAYCDMVLKTAYQMLLDFNARVLTAHVSKILTNEGISETFEFANGDCIFNLTTSHMGIPLSEDTLRNLENLVPTTVDSLEYTRYYEGIVNTFSYLPCVIEAVRRKTSFSLLLGFYTWKTAKSLFRKAYHHSAYNKRNGIGYLSQGDVYALVETHICSNIELDELRKRFGDKLKIGANTNPRSHDYHLIDTEEDLNYLKKRLDSQGCEYTVSEREVNGRKVYQVTHRLYCASAFVFDPCNLRTYEAGLNTLSPEILDF